MGGVLGDLGRFWGGSGILGWFRVLGGSLEGGFWVGWGTLGRLGVLGAFGFLGGSFGGVGFLRGLGRGWEGLRFWGVAGFGGV